MTINSQALTIALARQLAIADKRPQQAAIVQTAARLLSESEGETKENLMLLIAATPAQRQQIVSVMDKLFLMWLVGVVNCFVCGNTQVNHQYGDKMTEAEFLKQYAQEPVEFDFYREAVKQNKKPA